MSKIFGIFGHNSGRVVIGFWVTVRKILRVDIKRTAELLKNTKILYFQGLVFYKW